MPSHDLIELVPTAIKLDLLPNIIALSTLLPGQKSRVGRATVNQIWHFHSGAGWLWKDPNNEGHLKDSAMRVEPGVEEQIVKDTAFQLHNDTEKPLTFFVERTAAESGVAWATHEKPGLWPIDDARPSDYYDALNPQNTSTVATSQWGRCRIMKFSRSLGPPNTVLDAGCGSGAEAQIFIADGHKVTGIDDSPEVVKMLNETGRFQAHVGDVCAIDHIDALKSETFAACHCSFVFIHLKLEQGRRALEQFRKHLISGGKLFLATNILVDRARIRWWQNKDASKPTCFYDWRLHDLLLAIRGAGFEVQAVALERHENPKFKIRQAFVTATAA